MNYELPVVLSCTFWLFGGIGSYKIIYMWIAALKTHSADFRKFSLEPEKHLDRRPSPKVLSPRYNFFMAGKHIVEESARKLRVFLCHSSGDKRRVATLYDQLRNDGFDPWLDRKVLRGGQDWQFEIQHAVKRSHVVLVCLSRSSTTKEGFVQKEIRLALDVADEKPDGTIFLIPVRLEECEVPHRLRRWHWVDLYRATGYLDLTAALREREDTLTSVNENEAAEGHLYNAVPVASNTPGLSTDSEASQTPRFRRKRAAQIIGSVVFVSIVAVGVRLFLPQKYVPAIFGPSKSGSDVGTQEMSKVSLSYKIYGFEKGVLIGIMTDGVGRPISGVSVHVVGLRANDLTDDAGLFKLYLPDSVMPGSVLKLEIQKAGYPSLDSDLIVPSERVHLQP